jgi:hypothetical protein
VTVTVYVVVPLSPVGVPVICPVDVLKLSPAGKTGDTANVRLPNPPAAVTGVNGVAAVFCVSVVDATACVVVRAGNASTVRLNVLALVCAGVLWSVAVTVNVVADMVAVAVPDISPVAVFKDNPDGKLGLILNDSVPVPPVAVTGVNGVACMLWVTVLDATACTVTMGRGSTVSWKVLLLT